MLHRLSRAFEPALGALVEIVPAVSIEQAHAQPLVGAEPIGEAARNLVGALVAEQVHKAANDAIVLAGLIWSFADRHSVTSQRFQQLPM